MIYLASPYSHPNPAVREARYHMVAEQVAFMVRRELRVFSPILYTHPLADLHGLPPDFGYWRGFDTEMLNLCDVFFILRLPGWQHSVGVAIEQEAARHKGMPSYYIDHLTYDHLNPIEA